LHTANAGALECTCEVVMPGRFEHSAHVVRLAILFAGGFLAFVIVRSALVPDDFGVYGFYRAGALDDARTPPLQHAGEAACLDCHTEVADLRKEARHATVRCEACHGPLAAHVEAPFDVKTRPLDPRLLCLQCHTQGPGKSLNFPQIVPADHIPDQPCADCHKPHRPKID
jgi:hypothetical protein